MADSWLVLVWPFWLHTKECSNQRKIGHRFLEKAKCWWIAISFSLKCPVKSARIQKYKTQKPGKGSPPVSSSFIHLNKAEEGGFENPCFSLENQVVSKNHRRIHRKLSEGSRKAQKPTMVFRKLMFRKLKDLNVGSNHFISMANKSTHTDPDLELVLRLWAEAPHFIQKAVIALLMTNRA